jgi:hypothetical protein
VQCGELRLKVCITQGGKLCKEVGGEGGIVWCARGPKVSAYSAKSSACNHRWTSLVVHDSIESQRRAAAATGASAAGQGARVGIQ